MGWRAWATVTRVPPPGLNAPASFEQVGQLHALAPRIQAGRDDVAQDLDGVVGREVRLPDAVDGQDVVVLKRAGLPPRPRRPGWPAG